MKTLSEFAGAGAGCAGSCAEEDDAVVGLQASLRSSDSLRGILECARRRLRPGSADGDKLREIERICTGYEAHQKAVRDHCLDYFGSVPEVRMEARMHDRTVELLIAGRRLYARLRSAIVATY